MTEVRKKILIVDDDIDMISLMKMHVENFGFDVITADSQKEGEEIINSLKPDLAIFDLMMENKDSGFILSYKLKKKYPDVPVYLTWKAPNFKVRVGDFGTRLEAEGFLNKIKRNYPIAWVIRDKIKFPISN